MRNGTTAVVLGKALNNGRSAVKTDLKDGAI